MAPASILVGQLWHEGHSFNPIPTQRSDVIVTEGEALLDAARRSEMALSGIVRRAEALGYRCVPSFAARARPGGPLDEAVFQEVCERIVQAARDAEIVGICLELHGATIAQQTLDTEGHLLRLLREAVGPELPIAVALDLHAYVTEPMVRHATILTGYRTQPHADMAQTGERAMSLLHDIVRTGRRPVAAVAQIPFLTRGNDATAHGPLRPICDEADRRRGQPGMVDVSIFNVHPFIDAAGVGQVVLAYDQGGGEATAATEALATMLWQARDCFVEVLTPTEEALGIAASGAGLVALGDQGDRVTGGGPGDSVEILRVAAERFPGLAVAAGVFDPEAVTAAQQAGAGAVLEITIGGTVSPRLRKLRRIWRVERLLRARFTNRGPYMAGVEVDFGDAAVLTSDGLTAIVTSQSPNVHDPAFFEAMGVPLASQRAVVARAALHYKLSFAGIAKTITVDTPGMTEFRPELFPFAQARPIHPLDPVEWDIGSSRLTTC